MKRRQGEPVHDFIMRLRQQAVHCMFGETLERNLLSQFVAGSNMSAFQEKCCQTKDLKLPKAIEMAQAYESTAHNMNMLINPAAEEHTSAIMYTEQRSHSNHKQQPPNRYLSKQVSRNPSKQVDTKSKQCGYCGRDCKSKETCPAKGRKCINCGKLDHFAAMCRSSKANKGQAASRQSHIRQIDTFLNSGSTDSNTHTLDEAECAKYIRFKQAEQYGLFAVKSNDIRANDGPRVKATVENTKLLFLIDTGAPINVIDEVTYTTMDPKPTLEKCNTTFYGYKADEPLPIIGQFIAHISHNNPTIKAGFIVIKGQAELLLGHKTAIELGVIQICSRLTANGTQSDQNNKREKYKTLFPKLFLDKIG